MKAISLIRLPVKTKSGQALGTITEINVDPETQTVVSYGVKERRLLPSAVGREFLIHHSQVLSISETGVIVDDAAVTEKTPDTIPQPAA